jgi:hypothetical protein
MNVTDPNCTTAMKRKRHRGVRVPAPP